MQEWIMNNLVILVCISVILIGVIIMIAKNRKDVLLKSALYIVAKVEEEWGSGMGRVKFAEAYSYLKQTLPVVTFFLTEEVLTQIIEDALVELKKILTSKAGKDNK